MNISTRLRVDVGDKVMIAGFHHHGERPQARRATRHGTIAGRIWTPGRLGLERSRDRIARSERRLDYLERQLEGQPAEAQIQGTIFQPTDDRESVILATLPPAAYTVILKGVNQTSGIGLVEVYDNNQAVDSDLGEHQHPRLCPDRQRSHDRRLRPRREQ